MNWFQNMNKALTFIEDNLDKDIRSEVVAAQALSSKYHFIRLFTILTDMTFAEHIRGRRLTKAAKELRSGSDKVVDIALKYGYETPESFAEAFKKLHGVTPTEARLGDTVLKAIPPISFHVMVKGDERMVIRSLNEMAFKWWGWTG